MAWRHPSLLPVLPVVPPCLCPPAPPHPSLLRMLRLPLFTREHHLLSNSGYHRAADPPAFRYVGCWAPVPRAWQAAPLPQNAGPNAGWRLATAHPQAVRVQKSVIVLQNSTRQPREAGPCLGSTAPLKRARHKLTVTRRTTSRPHRDRLARRISLPEQVTGCQWWAKRWRKVKEVPVLPEAPVPLRNKARRPLHR